MVEDFLWNRKLMGKNRKNNNIINQISGKKGKSILETLGMTRADILLGVSFIIAGIISVAAIPVLGGGAGATVEIKVAGELKGIYRLDEDKEVHLEGLGSNTLEIVDGKASMIYADCPDQYCVHHRPVSKGGESIICLPNKVVVTIKGGEEQEVDAVVN